MIREITGYERTCSFRIKNQQEEEGLRRSAGLISLCLNTGGKEGERGELYHLYGGGPIAFCSLFQAVNRMEELYEGVSGPQNIARLRSFQKDQRLRIPGPEEGPLSAPKEIWEDGMLRELLWRRGAKATFWIRVLYRQHMSWQGEVTWVERQKKEYFRSALELLRLVDSALHADAGLK